MDANPHVGNPLGGGQKSAKSSPAGSARQRPSRADRTPVRLAAPTGPRGRRIVRLRGHPQRARDGERKTHPLRPNRTARGLAGLYASLVPRECDHSQRPGGSGADDRPRLPGKRGPPIQGSPLLREPGTEDLLSRGKRETRSKNSVSRLPMPPECASGRRITTWRCAEILTKRVRLSSK